MKALILAAGYGTRLYPLTKNKPKPLLPIAGIPIAEHIIKKVNAISSIDKIYLITNQKFFNNFQEWLQNFRGNKHIEIINDRTTSEDDRLGTIGDIQLTIIEKKVQEDLLIIGGDNIFTSGLTEFVESSLKKSPAPSIGIFNLNDTNAAKRFGVVKLNEESRVTGFQEKPEFPISSLISMCMYYFPKQTLDKFAEYLALGNNRDAMGHFVKWFSGVDKLYGYPFHGKWFDIGDKQAYYDAQMFFENSGRFRKQVLCQDGMTTTLPVTQF